MAMKYHELITKQLNLMKRTVTLSGKMPSRLSSARLMNTKLSLIKDITPRQNHLLAIKRFKCTSSLMSSTMADTKLGLCLTDILPMFLWNQSNQEWFACIASVLATDIGNAYLEAFTSEMVYIIARPEFGELEGHNLVISKALCGLCSSGAR
jgi:hypothetical protein